jgi:hypothetical protein
MGHLYGKLYRKFANFFSATRSWMIIYSLSSWICSRRTMVRSSPATREDIPFLTVYFEAPTPNKNPSRVSLFLLKT